ncbi:glycosyltransferase [Yeosuana sp. MJ-SS3]|uniref:Glycosyltransferase n=1 Tax=Gilvirhabdus luticola TaxID=3079858 RepID=A0ABU3U702_9FLAO|nr:glycosyltransferase [Yeosuana sp. MJ-SS3]MDU8886177.1 glycosyltransferase [Yeosuana sp. MJ-SS3]
MKFRKVRKALIITYYWPPAGGPGVQRWLKFVKYLPEFGVEPIVYVPENPNYPILDKSLLSDVPNSITILKQPIKEPYKFANVFSKKRSQSISKGIIKENDNQSILEKMMLYIRGNFFIPDARKSWIKPSVNYLIKYIIDKKVDLIITTGPPHSLHLIGLQLKKQLGVKWIADFRDPWTTIGYHKKLKLTKRAQLKHQELEHDVLNSANQIIVTSPSTKKEFEQKTNSPIEVITNGYDCVSINKLELDTKFTLSHIGSLLSGRNPKILWQVLKELIEENQEFKNSFQLNLVGSISEDVLNSIEKYISTNYINKVGYISHNESIKYQKKSQLLILIEIDSEETKCIVPGKLFEYMVSNRPIIAIGPNSSDVEYILKETNTGHYFNYSDYDLIKETILSHFIAFQNGELKSHAIGLQKYSRRELTKTLAKLILWE